MNAQSPAWVIPQAIATVKIRGKRSSASFTVFILAYLSLAVLFVAPVGQSGAALDSNASVGKTGPSASSEMMAMATTSLQSGRGPGLGSVACTPKGFMFASCVTTTGQTINSPVSSSYTQLVCFPSIIAVGQSQSCFVGVGDRAATGGSAPTGSVTLTVTGVTGTFTGSPCTLTPLGGFFSFCPAPQGGFVSFSATTTGAATITAQYGGDMVHATSSASFQTTVANLDPTSISIVCTPTTIVKNEQVSCTTTVTDTAATSPTTPTGKVVLPFEDVSTGSRAACTLSGTGATSTCTGTGIPFVFVTPPASSSDVAWYDGDATHDGSLVHISFDLVRTTTIIVACNPSSLNAGSMTTCTATVTDSDVGTPITPTGTVEFTTSGTGTFATSPCTLAAGTTSGTASCFVVYTPSGTTATTDTITASYVPDATHAASSNTGTVSVTTSLTPWMDLNISVSSPLQRVYASMAYDRADGYVLLFGGDGHIAGGPDVVFGDTWMFKAGTWTQLFPTTSPPAREAASMAFDAADGYVLLFGGYGVGCNGFGTPCSDTWIFKAGTWTQLSPTVSPPAREQASMAYDEADGYVLLFGGNSAGSLGDTWTFKAGTWTQLSPSTAPPATLDASMAYDAGDGYVLFFPACIPGCGTWTFKAGIWTMLSPSVAPPARIWASMAYDTVNGNVIFFGGQDGTTSFTDTWQFKAGTWTKLSPSNSPPSIQRGSMAFDEADGYFVLFGGDNGYGVTWEFKAGNWTTRLSISSSPLPSYDASTTYDAADGYVLLFGGYDGISLNDTWMFKAGTWTQLFPTTSPSARYSATMAYDAADGYVLLFGGSNGNVLSDTWMFKAGTWTQLSPSSHPVARSAASIAYDAADGYVVLFGGYNGAGQLGDTWQFKAGTWTQLSPTTSPTARYYASMAYDTADNYVLLFGGYAGNLVGDTWQFKGGSWTQLSTSGSPPAREAASLDYDAADGYVLLFGGNNGNYLSDTWEFKSGVWAQFSLTRSPSPRFLAPMTYDTADGYILLFGGYDSIPSIVGDSWRFVATSSHPTSTLLSCDNPVVWYQDSTCTATVTDHAGSPTTPTGTVAFVEAIGGTQIFVSCSLVPASSSSSSCSGILHFTASSGQTSYVFARYSGDPSHLKSRSDTFTITLNARASTIGVSCAPPSVTIAGTITCTVTMADTSPGTPQLNGLSISFSSNATGTFSMSQCVLNVAGASGTCSVTYTPTATAGIHRIKTWNSGPYTYNEAIFDLIVTPRTTSTSISCSPSTVVLNQPVTCTATVTDTSAQGPLSSPAGTVDFTSSGTGTFVTSPCTLAAGTTSGTASCSVSYTPTGTPGRTDTVTARYGGDADHDVSSNTATVTVGNLHPTTTTISCTPSTVALFDNNVCTFTVTDTSASGATIPSGGINAAIGGCGPLVPVAGTTATSACSQTEAPQPPYFSAGQATVTAQYTPCTPITTACVPDTTHAPSTGTTTLTLTLRATMTTGSCTPSTNVVGVPLTCTVTVKDVQDPGRGVNPSGTVTLTPTGSCSLSTVPTDPTHVTSSCTATIVPTATGTLSITASYPGSNVHAASTGITTVTINLRSTSTSVSCTPSTIVIGQSTNCAATVADTASGTVVSPTGTVNFGPTLSCMLTGGTTAGAATCSVQVRPSAVGLLVSVGADYGGDSVHSGSLGASNSVTVTKRTTGTAFHCDPTSVVVGASTTCRVAVTDESAGAAGLAITPTGSVLLTSSGTGSFNETSCTLSGSGPTSSCTVTYTPSGTAPRTDTLTASYSGDMVQATSTQTAQVSVLSNTDFTLTVTPSSATIASESSKYCHGNDEHGHPRCDDETSFNITIVGLNGFSGKVTLTVSASPNISTGLETDTISDTGSTTLTVGEASAGTYTVTVSATSGSLSHSASVQVTVRPPAKLKCGNGDSDNCGIESDAPLSNTNFSGHKIHFTMTGEAGTSAVANVTIPRSAVSNINKVKVYVDNNEMPGSNVVITTNTNNYYVYFKVTFHSNVDVDIDLNPSAPSVLGLDPTVFYSLAGISATVLVGVSALALSRRRRKA